MVLAENLRQAVLQAALQGKLTEQLETDSNVDDMMNIIKNEKEKLIIIKKAKRDKNWDDINEDGVPFEIPANWKWIHLGEIITFLGGYAFKSTSYVNKSKNQVVRLGNVKNGRLILNEKQVFVSDQTAKNAEDFKVKENDILVTMTGTRHKQDYLFTVKVSENDLKNNYLYLNQRVGCLRILSNVNEDFLCFAMQNEEIRKNIFAKETGTANQGNLGSEDIKEFVYIPLPPIEEQIRIIDKINEIMPKIDEYEKIEKDLVALKKEFPIDMKDALLQAAMQGKLTEQLESDSSVDELLASIKKEKKELIVQKKIKKEKPLPDIEEEEIPFDIPENWRWVKIGQIVDIRNGFTPKRTDESLWNPKEIPWFTVDDIHEQGLIIYHTEQSISKKALGKSSNRIIPAHTVLLCCTSATIGRYAMTEIEITTNQQWNGLVIKEENESIVCSDYILVWVSSLREKMIEIAKSTTFPFLSVNKLANFVIPLPPIEEQQRIVDRLDALLPLCEDLSE